MVPGCICIRPSYVNNWKSDAISCFALKRLTYLNFWKPHNVREQCFRFWRFSCNIDDLFIESFLAHPAEPNAVEKPVFVCASLKRSAPSPIHCGASMYQTCSGTSHGYSDIDMGSLGSSPHLELFVTFLRSFLSHFCGVAGSIVLLEGPQPWGRAVATRGVLGLQWCSDGWCMSNGINVNARTQGFPQRQSRN